MSCGRQKNGELNNNNNNNNNNNTNDLMKIK